MAARVFICYGHADQSSVNWLERLELYLAQARRSGNIDAWHDGRIRAGADWSAEIDDASALGALQAYNDPRQPLESLSEPDRNKILNALSVDVSRAVERTAAPAPPAPRAGILAHAMRDLWREMEVTGIAFRSQNTRCRALVDAVTGRLGVTEHLQFERFLFEYHARMTPRELFEFQRIRAVTEGPLAEGNRRMLDILLDHPALTDEVPPLTALRQHLVFWMNKYERVFQKTPAIAVCYVGVEDGVPWPAGAEEAVQEWLQRQPPEVPPQTPAP